jgi:oligopeptidase B
MPEHRRVPLLPDLPAPVAARIPHTEVLHGEARSDDYAWLRNPDDPAVRGYLEAENEYADAVLDSTRTLQERLYQEMVARIPEVERSLPEADDQADYFWVKRREDEHGSYVRRLRADGTEQTLLDLEAAGRGHAYAAVLRDSVSPDGRWWAWVIDTCGDEAGTLRVKDLATGDVLPDAIERVERFDWGKGAPDLLYVQRAGRWNRLFRHRLDGSPDTLLFQHEDWFFFSETADRLSIGIRVRHGTWDWRVHHLEATDAEAQANEWRDVRTDASVRGASFFDTDSFQDHTVQYRRERGRCALQVKRDNIRLRTIEFPEPVYDLHPLRPRPGPRARLDSYRFVLESFTTPPRCYEYDPGTEDLALIQSMDVPGCDGSRYQTRYLEVSSTEGARIPVSLAYLGTSPLHRRPVLLQAYGAYGASFPPSFDAGRLSLLDRGVVLAIAGVRGGGERGESWYRAGQGPRKRTSVQDLIAVARNLIDRGTTAPDRLALASGSAGGFLITAAANERPDLFQVVLADVPMTDLLAGLRDLPGSHEEWGDPAVEEEFRSLRELCPTANVKPQAYPAMLLRTAWLDSRVPCWAAARYVARLRAVKCDPNPVLLVTRWSGGHLGPSRRTDRLREEAQQFAFLLHRFGIDE